MHTNHHPMVFIFHPYCMEELLCYKLACAFLAVLLLGCLVYLKYTNKTTRGVPAVQHNTKTRQPDDVADTEMSTVPDDQPRFEEPASTGATTKKTD